jgi:hypothetical protein
MILSFGAWELPQAADSPCHLQSQSAQRSHSCCDDLKTDLFHLEGVPAFDDALMNADMR